MDDESTPAIADETLRGMVRNLVPSWEVAAIERADHGTDSVAILDVETPAGDRSAVLKATTADHASPESARAEPRLLSLVGQETEIPVPEVFGLCDDHEEYPAPFYLMARVDGENFEGRADELSPRARERVFREAGEHLAQLHDLGPLPRVGGLGVRDGELAVLEDDGGHDGFHDWLLDSYEGTLDSLADGEYFPDLADDRSRFADLVPDVRRYLRETVPELPDPGPPTYCNKDYRYGNLLLDPETGGRRLSSTGGTSWRPRPRSTSRAPSRCSSRPSWRALIGRESSGTCCGRPTPTLARSGRSTGPRGSGFGSTDSPAGWTRWRVSRSGTTRRNATSARPTIGGSSRGASEETGRSQSGISTEVARRWSRYVPCSVSSSW